MKHVRILGLAAVAAMALMALVGAGTASAATSTLCSTATNPCTSPWAIGTVMDFSLKAGTSAKLTDTSGNVLDTCTESTVKGKLAEDSRSTPGTLAGGPISELLWGACTNGTHTKKTGGLQVEALAGGNGTVKATGETKVEIEGIFGVTCFYGVTAGTTLGELKEGNPATFVANAVAKRLEGGFLCPETTKWTAEYTLTEPSNTTLYVVSP